MLVIDVFAGGESVMLGLNFSPTFRGVYFLILELDTAGAASIYPSGVSEHSRQDWIDGEYFRRAGTKRG